MTRKTWRCFHCGEVFTSPRWAAEHFGAELTATPACKLTSHEGHLVTYIRKLEADLASYRADDTDILRSIYALEADHRQALIRAEEAGYEKGLRDGEKLNFKIDGDGYRIEQVETGALLANQSGGPDA